MTKKICFTCLIANFVMLFSLSGYSQDKNLRTGMRIGVNLSNTTEDIGGTETIVEQGISFDLSTTKNNGTALSFGGFVEYGISSLFALQLGIIYNPKGIELKQTFNTTIGEGGFSAEVKGNVDNSVNLTYISFPLLGKLSIGGGNVKPYVLGGGELGYLISAKSKEKGEVSVATEVNNVPIESRQPIAEFEDDIKDDIEKIDIGLNFGAGLQFSVANLEFFLEGQYNLGLTKINKVQSNGDDINNRAIYINMGLIFP